MSKTNGSAFTRADIDRYAVLSERVKALQEECDELKKLFRQSLQPKEQAFGYVFMVELSETPEVKGKPDYRSELIKAIGDKKVAALESLTAQAVTFGTPRVMVKANPRQSPDDLQAALTVRKKLYKAIGEGKSSKEIVEELKVALG